jgi:hypothetical protein
MIAVSTTVHYPVKVEASLDRPLSRWLWLVKWLLALPHFIVLAFLWVAFVVLSIVAFFAILFTGHYPRPIFDFNVGVLRWTWRVQYYAYGALGTDRYPPFSLAERPDYPAHLEIAYPEHLSRGLVLVKWWLLAIPHYLVLAFFLGGGAWVASNQTGDQDSWGGPGLIALLAVFAGVVLLVTGRYPGAIYDFLLGMNRWVLRVAAYAGLMTDAYPPFRLDMGGHEPDGSTLTVSSPTPPGAPGEAATAPTAPIGPPTGEMTAAAPQAPPPEKRKGWTGGRIVSVVVGAVLVLVGLGMAVPGAVLLAVDQTQRDDAGYLGIGTRTYSTAGYAVTSGNINLDEPGAGWISYEDTIGTVRLSVTGTDPDTEVFIGVAPSGAAASYIGDVARLTVGDPEINDLPGADTERIGGAPDLPPTEADIWVASTSGPAEQAILWQPEAGDWTVVAMNADGSPGVDVRAELAATLPALTWVAGWLLGIGLALIVLAVVLIVIPVSLAGRG